ncbi:rhomboid family intramembrane serine protease [Demequina sp.]|uniref:rhomboid family intramembrane serine protease n=1 Tax=Demequina sp. TaxID=2050685 RepID=UPI0025C3F214|nr:rhomboid family intramembrane serine protease [Demequina sp.]
MSEPTQGAPQQAPPVCPRHPDRVSYVRCQRCERPACPQCQVPAPVGVLCVDCARAASQAARGARTGLGFPRALGRPYVTIGIIVANVAFYVYGMGAGLSRWHATYGLWPALTDQEPWRWLTSGFVHGSLWHIGINMYVLYQFGSQLEQVMGRLRFGILYGVSLVGGSAAIQVLATPNSLHVGASGAVFGMFGAYGILLYKLKLPWQSMATTAGLWLAVGFFLPGISWEGHIGGLLLGTLTMGVMLRLVGQSPFTRVRR